MAQGVTYDTGDLKGQSVPGLVKVGNIDLNHRPQVKNDDGSSSTIFSVTVPINRDGSVWKGDYAKAPQYALVPSIVNGKFLTSNGKKPAEGDKKAAQRLEDAATDHYADTREHLGIFSSSDAAEKYTDVSHAYGNDGTDRKVFTPSMSEKRSAPAGKSVPMISPSGKAIMVPEGEVEHLISDGGSRAVKMTKDGSSPRWVPEDHVAELLTQPGVKLSPDNDQDTFDKFDTSRNAIQKSFDKATRTSPNDPLLKTAIKSTVAGAGTPLIHPWETAKAVARSIPSSPADIPRVVGDMVAPIAQDYQEGGAAYAATKAAGGLLGNAALGEAGGALLKGARAVPINRVPSALGKARERFVQATYPKNAAISPGEAAGQEFAKTFNLPAGEAGTKRFQQIKEASGEVPHVLAHAESNSIPVNGKLDFSKAAGSAAKEVQAHITDKLYGPHKGKIQAVPTSYAGETMGGPGKASIGQIQDRINNIREALNDKTRTSGLSDQELKAERNALTRITHEAIGKFNGMTPEAVAEIEARAGKLRTLEKETRSAANRDTITSGRQETGRSGIASVGRLAEEGVQRLGGGPEVIGNRVFKDALAKFTPQETPLPQPPPPAATEATSPEAAQAEFLRAHALEQASQDAAAGRSRAVQTYRGEQTAGNVAEANREFLHQNELQNQATDSAVTRARKAYQERVNREASDEPGVRATDWREFEDAKRIRDEKLAQPNRVAAQNEFLHQRALQTGATENAVTRARIAYQERAARRANVSAAPMEVPPSVTPNEDSEPSPAATSPRIAVDINAGRNAPIQARGGISGIGERGANVLTPTRKLPATYRVVEAHELTPSHDAMTFAENPNYPKGVQERDYQRSREAQNRVINQAQNYDPAYTINTNPDAVNGPPVITPDGTVLGGNSRAMSTQRLYVGGQGDVYKSALKRDAATYGVTPEQIDSMKQPVLVRQIEQPASVDDARRIGSELNKSMTGALGGSEKAVSAGRNLKQDTLQSVSKMMQDDDISLRELLAKRGPDVLRMMEQDGVITARERPQFSDPATGGLNDDGKTFFEKALMGAVVDDPRLMDSVPKSVLAKVEHSLGDIHSFGTRPDEWNLLPAMRQAMAEHGVIARNGSSVDMHLNQRSIFGGERNPVVDSLIRTLNETPKSVRSKLAQYATDSSQNRPGEVRMFGGGEAHDAFNHAFGSNLSPQEFHNAISDTIRTDPSIATPEREQGSSSPGDESISGSDTGQSASGGGIGSGQSSPTATLAVPSTPAGEAGPNQLGEYKPEYDVENINREQTQTPPAPTAAVPGSVSQSGNAETVAHPAPTPAPAPEPSEDAAPTTHPLGDVTGIDHDSGLPIVKRTPKPSPAAQDASTAIPDAPEGSNPTPKPADTTTPAVSPDTHVFSRTQFKASNPDADVEAAAKAAQDEGYEVGP